MDIYTKIFQTKKFIGTQPHTFNRHTYKKDTTYYLTQKLDGLRSILVMDSKNSVLFTSKMECKPFVLKSTKFLKPTVVDGEIFNEKYYAFDILFYNGKDLRNEIFSIRLKYLKKLHSLLVNDTNFKIKKYYSPYKAKLLTNYTQLLSKIGKNLKNGRVDGIIFTPDYNYLSIPLKWKPNNLLSIDFKIRKKTKKNSEYYFELLLQNGKLFKFKGISGIVKVSKKTYNHYNGGGVVEFVLKNNKFYPIRDRPDKVNSNHISVIKSNLKTILDNATVESIIS